MILSASNLNDVLSGQGFDHFGYLNDLTLCVEAQLTLWIGSPGKNFTPFIFDQSVVRSTGDTCDDVGIQSFNQLF